MIYAHYKQMQLGKLKQQIGKIFILTELKTKAGIFGITNISKYAVEITFWKY